MEVIKTIGIYKIVNTLNNKCYIGQSINIQNRLIAHTMKSAGQYIDKSIQYYGKENFTFEVIEKCSTDKLNEKEIYWIAHFNSYYDGYNQTLGGQNSPIGEYNPNSKLAEKDISDIRKRRFLCNEAKTSVYEDYKDRISYSGFTKIWTNANWNTIGQSFYSIDRNDFINKEEKSRKGQKNGNAKFSDEQVLELRTLYKNHSIKEMYQLYGEEFQVCYGTMEQMLIGKTYKHLPVYKKSIDKWI